MSDLSAEVKGMIEVELPDDIAERLQVRAERGRLLGAGTIDHYRVERIEVAAETPYRTSRGRPAGVRLIEVGGRSTESPLEDVTLLLGARSVRYHVRFPRWRRNGVVAGALLGGMLALLGAWLLRLSVPLGVGMFAVAAGTQLALWLISNADARTKAHLLLAQLLAAEAVPPPPPRLRVAAATEDSMGEGDAARVVVDDVEPELDAEEEERGAT